MKFSIKVFSVNQESADLVTFTEEIFNGKLHFLCSNNKSVILTKSSGVTWASFDFT